ncbi:MAG: biotin--[acetyl-CoA-carboxylase] ligase [Myxococcota bacterium]|nr:biotin--[acetyl-CoA-carboxylase] ligase [Myxococcota bacterium]
MKNKILELASCKSTNDEARKHLDDPVIRAVVAARQTEGRGRLGRTWFSESGMGLYLSWVGRPGFQFNLGSAIPLLAAVAVSEVLEENNIQPTLKWPNDLLVGHRKLAGILCEAQGTSERWGVVIGIGLNLATPSVGWPDELNAIALDEIISAIPERMVLATAIVDALNQWVQRVEQGGLKPVLSAWMRRSVPIGTPMMWTGQNGQFGGLNGDGSLRFITDSGIHSVHSGDVLLTSESEL